MATTTRRTVISGLGVLTPIGTDPESYRRALAAGTSGVRAIQSFDASSLPCRIAGEFSGFDAKKYLTEKDQRRSLKAMARTVQMGAAAAQLAMADAGLKKGSVTPARFGIEFACVMVATDVDDVCGASKASCVNGSIDLQAWGSRGLEQVPPLWMLKYLPNMPACHTSIFFDARGPNNTITASDNAGLLALGEAYRTLVRSQADFFLVGGVEGKVNPVSFTRHNLFTSFTKRNDDPARAIRPFDRTRDGSTLGDGAAVFCVEDWGHAKTRGAKVYAELVGFASGFDKGKKGPTFSDVIRRALTDARIQPADVDHVNAAARGDVALDAWEARAVHAVFGTDTPVFSAKGHLGNSGAASGLVELAASVLALHHGELPGTLNFTTPDPACPVRVHAGLPRKVTKPYAIKLSYTEMGQCTAVVVKRWD
ncbi:MAG TPA: beta-ketoacyl-[acyl-carrier-protein] synthase family protein [Fimbriiglobus sp.]|jgi:3-oxoacyl-[acyl-carrier-protein] synthase II